MEYPKIHQIIFYFISIVFNYFCTKIYLIIIKKLKISQNILNNFLILFQLFSINFKLFILLAFQKICLNCEIEKPASIDKLKYC